eukprot:1763275-Heterocapsa_arctica.AAC.1
MVAPEQDGAEDGSNLRRLAKAPWRPVSNSSRSVAIVDVRVQQSQGHAKSVMEPKLRPIWLQQNGLSHNGYGYYTIL